MFMFQRSLQRGHKLSGPAAFSGHSFLGSPLSWSAVKQGGGCEEVRGAAQLPWEGRGGHGAGAGVGER